MDETITVRLDGRYAGWEAEMDADPDAGVFADFDSGKVDTVYGAMARVLLRWNFRDKAGHEVPPTADGIRRTSFRALAALMQEYGRGFRALPNR